MGHEMFKIASASERELDVMFYGGVAGVLIMLVFLGVLLWRDRHKIGKRFKRGESRRRKKPKKRR